MLQGIFMKLLKLSGLILVIFAILLLGGAAILDTSPPALAAGGDDSQITYQIPPAQNGSSCVCSGGDSLNCEDFANQDEAQTCFNQCLGEVGFDVHDLDTNGDGSVCENSTFNNTTTQQAQVTPQPVIPALDGSQCDCTADTLECSNFDSQQDAQACHDRCLAVANEDVHGLDEDSDGVVCESTLYLTIPTPLPTPTPTGTITPESGETTQEESAQAEATAEPEAQQAEAVPVAEPVAGANNEIFNGNFEYGFFPVPELGFEIRDTGAVPNDWNWYKSNTYGKVTIYNNEGFGLVCADDTGLQEFIEDNSGFGPIPGVGPSRRPNNSLSLHIQSSDEQDMRLGVYQVVDVTPGQMYRLTMSGTVQVQSGAGTLQSQDPFDPIEAQNHAIEVSFDHRGGTDWQAIPLDRRTIWNLEEEKLEFKVSETDEDIAEIQNFETFVRAGSDKMTVFITGWRKWANWRTGIFTIDCISLVPVDAMGNPIGQHAVATSVDVQAVALQPGEAPASDTQIIPPSGGILENNGNTIFIIVAAAVVLLGLVGAGIWNARRH